MAETGDERPRSIRKSFDRGAVMVMALCRACRRRQEDASTTCHIWDVSLGFDGSHGQAALVQFSRKAEAVQAQAVLEVFGVS